MAGIQIPVWSLETRKLLKERPYGYEKIDHNQHTVIKDLNV